MYQIQVRTFVVKRDGRIERFSLGKFYYRIEQQCIGLRSHVDPTVLVNLVQEELESIVVAVELDELAAKIAAGKAVHHPFWMKLAARLELTKLHWGTNAVFTDVINELYQNVHETTGKHAPLISQDYRRIIMDNAQVLNNICDHSLDRNFDYFALVILQRKYLLKINGVVVERPQHMFMRIAVATWLDDIVEILNSYKLMSEHYFVHCSNTLKNAATKMQQLQSNFTLVVEDNLQSVFQCLNSAACLSKLTSNVGIAIQDVRVHDALIDDGNGVSKGVVPILQLFDSTFKYIRKTKPGQFAFYIEPWHKDIYEFLSTSREGINPNFPDLFHCIWIPDLFMQRVQSKGMWSLMCPHSCPGLSSSFGDDFVHLYEDYEAAGNRIHNVPAIQLWQSILNTLLHTESTRILFKDSCNSKSNHQHLGTIKCSNLSGNMLQFCSSKEFAGQISASISLKKFVDLETTTVNYDELMSVTKQLTRNLNRLLDATVYPLQECRQSNLLHRPISIGVQGLADMFSLLKIPFDSTDAGIISKHIAEAIYFAALETSCNLAETESRHMSYNGSPVSQGTLQLDMWPDCETAFEGWPQLRQNIQKHGLRNSLLISLMPTTNTSQILGNTPSVEPYRAIAYKRKVFKDEYLVINENFMNDLIERNVWNDGIMTDVLNGNGSLAEAYDVPDDIKEIYKTAWDLPVDTLAVMARDRAPFIDQSQPIHLYLIERGRAILSLYFTSAWKAGLKTGLTRFFIRKWDQCEQEIEDTEGWTEVQEAKRKKANLPSLSSCTNFTELYKSNV